MKFTAFVGTAYRWLVKIGSSCQSALLLVIRLYWGFSFTQTGWGKLMNHSQPAEFFASLGIPFPGLSAWLAGGTEFLGGILLFIGLASRLATLPLIFTMAVAYITTEQEALQQVGAFLGGLPGAFTGNLPDTPDKFTSATPFLFLYACVLILVFGPGRISIDYFLARKFGAARGSSANLTFSRDVV